MPPLSTTSYAVLALLAVQPWTTYELAKQMDRSLHDLWPRAESVIYEEPKRLVARGLATSTKHYTGRRAATVYAITDEGRDELRRWLSEPGAGPVMEHEALLQVAFADQGDLASLRANLAAMRERAEAECHMADQRLQEYHHSGGPFPHRLPVIALVARFLADHAALVARWAEWAEHEVEGWTGVTPGSGARVPAIFPPATGGGGAR
ncbi:MAG TPA: PadR family transcriptional regulator [Acidimicrobiales bacterium]|nr:PadR family transcriptional regulator [Acidimicrobiales bacterium]